MKRALAILALALVAGAYMGGCQVLQMSPAGPMLTDSRSVKQDNAKSVAVKMDMQVGDLKLMGGASDLMNADFEYNIPGWKPDVQYAVNGDRATLAVEQPSVNNMRFIGVQNHWNVRLRDELPMSLAIRSDTGSRDLRLNGLNLTDLTVDSDTGSNMVDLSGTYASLKSVGVRGDTGGCTLLLTGSYPVLTSLNVECDTGGIHADLSGNWEKNATVKLAADTGGISVTLPKNIGVYVTTHKETGDISANGLIVQGNVYTNAAYGKSPVTLRVNVSVDTGGISLRTAD